MVGWAGPPCSCCFTTRVPLALQTCGLASLTLSPALTLRPPHPTCLTTQQMSGCRARLEMADGPRGPFGRLVLAGPPEAVAFGQWLLGQRLSAAASYQMGGTSEYG